jgi:hypothetical protein
VFAVLALGVVVPYELIVLAATGRNPFDTHASVQTVILLTLLDSLVIGGLISALYVHALRMIDEGGALRIGQVVMRGVQVLPTVVAAQIIATLGIGLGLILIIPGIILAIRWAVVAQAAAIENENWVEALKRSGELTAGNYLHVLGLLIAAGLIAVTLTNVAIAIVGTHRSVGAIAVGIVVETLARSFVSLTASILFFDLRARKQALRV